MTKINNWMSALLLASILILRTPNPYDGQTGGMFFRGMGVAWCTSTYTCIHEAGHMLDERMGHVSQTEAFAYVVDNVQGTWVKYINNFPQTGRLKSYNQMEELYAEMYYWSIIKPGYIPIELEIFYRELY